MREHLILRMAGLVIGLSFLGRAAAEVPSGIGERFAKEAMGLVAFAEMGNIGARDSECKGTPFPVADINSLVDAEIVPILDTMIRAEGKSNPTRRAETISLLKKMPNQKDRGIAILQRVYDQKKQEALASYGTTGVCSALSAMVQTVIQQKRLALRDITILFGSMKLN